MSLATRPVDLDWQILVEQLDPRLAALKLNPAQQEAVIAVKPFLAKGIPSFVDMPPRSGKTGLFWTLAEILYKVSDQGERPRFLFLTSTKHLRRQILNEATKFAPTLVAQNDILELDEGSKFRRPLPTVTIATYEMILGLIKQGALSLGEFHVQFEDEGHLTLTELRQGAFKSEETKDLRRIAFTGTSAYYIEKSLETAGYAEAYRLSIGEAQRRRIIAPHRNIILDIEDDAFSLAGVDISSTDKDYDTRSVDKVINQTRLHHIMADFLLNWRDPLTGRYLRDMVGIIACNSIDHARNFSGIVNSRRLEVDFSPHALCMPVWGTMPDGAFKNLIGSHRNGTLRALACEKVILTGYDNPLVEYILNIAPTRSSVRAGQRGSRPLTAVRSGRPKPRGLVFDVAYPGSRNQQIFFNDFAYGGLELGQPDEALETVHTSDEELPKAQIRPRTRPDFDSVRIYLSDNELRSFAKRRTLELLLKQYPDLSEVTPSIRDRMIAKKIYKTSDLASAILRFPSVIRWRLDSPRAFYQINRTTLDRLVRGKQTAQTRDASTSYETGYRPAAAAIAAFFNCLPKQLFGPLDRGPYENMYLLDRVETFRDFKQPIDVSGRATVPEFPIIRSVLEIDPIDDFYGHAPPYRQEHSTFKAITNWMHEHQSATLQHYDNYSFLDFYFSQAELFARPKSAASERPVRIPTIDELKSGHFFDGRDDHSPYDLDGNALELGESRLIRFPLRVNDTPFSQEAVENRTTLFDIWNTIHSNSSAEFIERRLEDQERVAAVREVLSQLSSRQVNVVKLRFGFDGHKPHTLDEAAEAECVMRNKPHTQDADDRPQLLAVTRERIRQIELKAFARLARPFRAKQLISFLETAGPVLTRGNLEPNSNYLSVQELAKLLRTENVEQVRQIFSRFVDAYSAKSPLCILRFDPANGIYWRASILRNSGKTQMKLHRTEVARFALVYGFDPSPHVERISYFGLTELISVRDAAKQMGAAEHTVERICRRMASAPPYDKIDGVGEIRSVESYDPVQQLHWNRKLFKFDNVCGFYLDTRELGSFAKAYSLIERRPAIARSGNPTNAPT